MTTAEDIRGAVNRALTSDPMIDSHDIEVDVLQSTVLLNGTVPSQAQAAEATAAASRVAGVADVYNLLEVALPSDDYGNDAALAGFANQALAANPAVPAGVSAVARDGNITLTGAVRSDAEKAAAQETIASVGGVLLTVNHIVVLSG